MHTFRALIVFPFQSVPLIGSKPDILVQRVFLSQLSQIFLSRSVFQAIGTPPHFRPHPAETVIVTAELLSEFFRITTLDWCVAEVILEVMFRLDSGNRSADVLLHLVDVVVHRRKFQSRVHKKNHIHRPLFLKQPKEHGCGVLAAGETDYPEVRLHHSAVQPPSPVPHKNISCHHALQIHPPHHLCPPHSDGG